MEDEIPEYCEYQDVYVHRKGYLCLLMFHENFQEMPVPIAEFSEYPDEVTCPFCKTIPFNDLFSS